MFDGLKATNFSLAMFANLICASVFFGSDIENETGFGDKTWETIDSRPLTHFVVPVQEPVVTVSQSEVFSFFEARPPSDVPQLVRVVDFSPSMFEVDTGEISGSNPELNPVDSVPVIDDYEEVYPSIRTSRPSSQSFYAEIDYIQARISGANTVGLLSTNPAGTSIPDSGIRYKHGMTDVWDGRIGKSSHAGFHLRLGSRIRQGKVSRFELDGWSLSQYEHHLDSQDLDNTILSDHFYNGKKHEFGRHLIRHPDAVGVNSGSAEFAFQRAAWGTDQLIFLRLNEFEGHSSELFFGFRYFQYADTIRSSYRYISDVNPPYYWLNWISATEDKISASNDYFLMPVGLNLSHFQERWGMNCRLGFALGLVSQKVDVQGSRTIQSLNTNLNNFNPFPPEYISNSYPGGNLGSESLGLHTRQKFTWSPQGSIEGFGRIGHHLRIQSRLQLVLIENAVQSAKQFESYSVNDSSSPTEKKSGGILFDKGEIFIASLSLGLAYEY